MKTMQLPRPSRLAAPASFLPSFGKIAVLAAITTFIGLPITRAAVITPREINIGPGDVVASFVLSSASTLLSSSGGTMRPPLASLRRFK